MQQFVIRAMVALSWQRVLSQSLFPDSTSVTEFPGSAFDTLVLADKRTWFVVYYADWCPHCQVFAPVWERIAAEWKDEPRVVFGAVDCAVWVDWCGKQGIEAYPTLRAYHIPGSADSETKRGMGTPIAPIEKEVKTWIATQIAKLPNASPPHGHGSINSEGTSHVDRGSSHVELPASAASARLRLIDAEVAILYSLRQGVFLHVRNGRLEGEELLDLLTWLNFLAASLPSLRACADLRALVDAVKSNQEEAGGVLDRGVWTQILDRWSLDGLSPAVGIDPSPHWRACGTYTCGLWNLFHIVTVAPRDTGIGQKPASSVQNSTVDSLAMVRIFVARFFGCADCASHFLDTYDSCEFGRCDLLPGDVMGAALWLWRVHEKVTQRVAKEKEKAVPAAWPPVSDCPECWPGAVADSVLVSDTQQGQPSSVYAYLQHSYWQPTESAGFIGSGILWKWTLVGLCGLCGATCLVLLCMTLLKCPKGTSSYKTDNQGESFLCGEQDVEMHEKE